MNSKRSILTSLVLGVFALMFLIILFTLSDNLNTLLDLTRTTQEDSDLGDRGKWDESGTAGVKGIGENFFRGNIPQKAVSRKPPNQVDPPEASPEASLPDDKTSSEEVATDELQMPLDRRKVGDQKEVNPSATDRANNYVFCVHYASHKQLADAKAEVASLSEKGFHASWVKTDVPGKGEWFRVYIGSEKTRQEAMDFALKLKKGGVIKEIYLKKLKAE